MTEQQKIEAQINADRKMLREGIAYHRAEELQFAKDRIAAGIKELKRLDYEARKPFIKIETVERQTGNSSVNAKPGKRRAIDPSGRQTFI